MRKLLCILSLMLPIIANAMKIAKDEIDEFTGERTVITSWESVCQKSINIRFRLQGGECFLDFKYTSGTSIVVPENGLLLFKSETDNISKFYATRMFAGGIGDGAVNFVGSKAWGISAVYKGDISWFLSNTTRLLRLYEADVYTDKKLSSKDGEKLTQLASLFLNTIRQDKTE